MPQLGRITGPLLEQNLLRNGVDLAFETNLLYLDVNDDSIGIKKNPSSVYDLDIDNSLRTNNIIVDAAANIDNIIINSPSSFTTSVGPINIVPTQNNPLITIGRMTSDSLIFNDNSISSISGSNIVLDPNGTGTVELQANTTITPNNPSNPALFVSGNIRTQGPSANIQLGGNLIIGDRLVDTITIAPDFTQSIVPGADLIWSLGQETDQTSAASLRRWAEMHIADETNIDLYQPDVVFIANRTRIDGISNSILALQSNEDILLSPDTGVLYIERTKWENSYITNLNNTPITFAGTSNGYLRFNGDNGFVVPAGTDAERNPSPEVGETRWNTDQDYLECFDGTVWNPAIGAGGSGITVSAMEDLGHIYTIILG